MCLFIGIDPPPDKVTKKWASRKRPLRSAAYAARKRKSSSESIPSILAGSDFEFDDDYEDAVADDEGTDGTRTFPSKEKRG